MKKLVLALVLIISSSFAFSQSCVKFKFNVIQFMSHEQGRGFVVDKTYRTKYVGDYWILKVEDKSGAVTLHKPNKEDSDPILSLVISERVEASENEGIAYDAVIYPGKYDARISFTPDGLGVFILNYDKKTIMRLFRE